MDQLAGPQQTSAPKLGALALAHRHHGAVGVTPDTQSSQLNSALVPLGAAAGYFLAAELGAWLAFPSAPVSAFWAPNAIVLAALILAPRNRWWAYLLAVLPFHFLAQLPETPLPQVTIQYLMNCAEALIGAIAIERLCPQPCRFDRLRDAFVLIIFGGIIAPLVTSLILAGLFAAIGLSREFWLTVGARTITNTFAVIALVPLIVHVVQGLRSGRTEPARDKVSEATLLAICLGATAFLVFVLPSGGPHASFALLYAPLPLVVWAAMRFGVSGACSAALLVALFSTWGVLHGRGPFTVYDPVQNALSVVAFQVVTAIALLLLAALLEERRSAEAARVTAESLHAAVLASLHDEIAVIDPGGTIVEINESWRRSVHHAAASRFDRVLAGENFVTACARAAVRGDQGAAGQLSAVRAVLDGCATRRQMALTETSAEGPCWYEVSIEQLRRPEGGAVVTRTDVTARKRAELEASNQRQQLHHLSRAAVLGELSGAFAHELNQPLAAILGNAEAALTLLAGDGATAQALREILTDIVHDDERATLVIQRLRALLRNEPVQRQPVSLNAIVDEVVELLRSELTAHSVRVSLHLDGQTPMVMADRVQMQQLFLNLLLNACQAMAGTPPADRRLSIETHFIPDDEARVEVAVADTGCGIPAGELGRIFQPFVTTKAQGMGLGLSICKSVAEAHCGRLWAESGAGAGAVFRLSMPLRQAATGNS